jgi:feruloyl-CoA synthase
MHIGRAVCTVSSAYCRLTKDYTKIHGILATLGPALVYAADAPSTARRWPASGIDAVAVFSQGAEAFPGALSLRQPAAHRREPGGEGRLRRDPARRPRQVPADLGLDRPPQGGDQHPPHAVRQPADDRPGLALPRAREAGTGRLAALEPHLRRQPQPEPGAAQRRHAVHRRRPAGAGADREVDAATCARCAPTLYFNVPRGYEMLLPFIEADDALAGASSPGCAWPSTPAPRCRRPPGSGSRRWRAKCATSRCGSPPPGVRPRPRRPSPAPTGSSTAPASSACRCPASS